MDLQIVHVVLGKANPERMNGVNKVVNSLATSQSELGKAVSVWGITKDLTVNYPERNYKTVLFADKGKFSLDSAWDARLRKQSKTRFSTFMEASFRNFLGRTNLNKAWIQVCFTPHGAYNTVAMQRSSIKKKVYVTFFEKQLVKSAKCVHFIGKSEVDGAAQIFGHLNHCLIPNGQRMNGLDFEFKSLRDPQVPVFGFVGRIDIKTKGLDILLVGFAKFVQKNNRKAELWIIGDGKEEAKLKALARELKIEHNVRFWGSKFGEEKLNLIANMDYMCLTSRNEGLPGVVLEAMAIGVPCIVSKETNMGGPIQDSSAGFCLLENNADELATTIEGATENVRDGKSEEQAKNALALVENCTAGKALRNN